MIRRTGRRRGMSTLQAVLLLGAGFLVAWGLMDIWKGTEDPLTKQVKRTLNGQPGEAYARNPGGGGNNVDGRVGTPPPTPTPTPPPVPGPTPTPTPIPTPRPSPGGLTTMPAGTSHVLSEMDHGTLFSDMSEADRVEWHRSQVAPYAAQLKQSAAANGIPERLLAAVILNELADIEWKDTWQANYPWSNGSLGIGQIVVDTAIDHDLVTYPGDDPTASGWRAIVRDRLKTPEIAIEAAARYIRHNLIEMTMHTGNPWQRRFGFTLTTLPANPADLYAAVTGATQREREVNLAELVVAAYNSPEIVIAQRPGSITRGHPEFRYPNGTAHGANSRPIAGELFDAGLYR